MRIAIFSESYEPVVNGVSVSIRTLIDGLSARGHDVHVFAPDFRGFDDGPQNVYRFPSFHSILNPDYPFPLPVSLRLKREFERLKPDIVHTQTPYLLGSAGMRWAQKFGVPLVSTNHTLYLEYVHYVRVIPKPVTRMILAGWLRKYYNSCRRIVVPSPVTERQLRELGVETPAEVIPTGVAPEQFRFPHMRERLRSELGVPPGAVTLLYVGRIALEKNIRMLLNSYAALLKQSSNVHLVIVGGGPYETEARALASSLGVASHVTFTGMKPHSQLGPLFSVGDVFVFPSATDTQGIALIEAMVAGLPCVVVDVGGCPEMVSDGVSGLVCSNDVKAYTKTLQRIVTDGDLRAKLAHGAVSCGQGFTVEAMAEKIERVYRAAIDSTSLVESVKSEPAVQETDRRLEVKG